MQQALSEQLRTAIAEALGPFDRPSLDAGIEALERSAVAHRQREEVERLAAEADESQLALLKAAREVMTRSAVSTSNPAGAVERRDAAGKVEQVKESHIIRHAIERLESSRTISPDELYRRLTAEGFEVGQKNVGLVMSRLAKKGLLVREHKGVYRPARRAEAALEAVPWGE